MIHLTRREPTVMSDEGLVGAAPPDQSQYSCQMLQAAALTHQVITHLTHSAGVPQRFPPRTVTL